jgi:hypothetical protein
MQQKVWQEQQCADTEAQRYQLLGRKRTSDAGARGHWIRRRDEHCD